MSGYNTRVSTVQLGGHDYRIRSLSDRQQFADPLGRAAKAGISSANWSLFGQLWPSGRLLAEAMSEFDVAGKRVLELGCGLGLASLVLTRRGANVTASDHHPLAEVFLSHNAGLNDLSIPHFHDLQWAVADEGLGCFDLIIASDVLYERDHAVLLTALCERHAQPKAEVVITDPGRGNSGGFTRAMAALGFSMEETRTRFDAKDRPPFRGCLLHYRRG
ncbi:MAG: methyltransferase domain-containing protein [Xanthomonadales bacterium]|nr:methyltransferase domain-containing protein [Xanthomonadales bacterium]MBK7145222.1 methyltransferase domain-containing protein [Xanthomonadales bacterium]